MYNVELRSQRSQTNQSKRKEGCGLKYRVVSILKDNRPRFLIISDIEEIEILPSKYLKHLDQINASPNTVKSAAFALSYYYNYLQEQKIGLDEITLLSYSEQNKHFIDFLYWVKSGKHTEHNTQTSNKTCNMYLGAVFRYYQFLVLEDVLPMLKVLRVKKVSYFDSMGVNHQNAVNSFKGFFKEEEPNMDRFQFDKSRINASSPVKSLSFINIYEKENRWYLQLYAKYLVGISDLSLSNIRNTISFISQFLKYLDGQSKKVTELEMQDIADYVSVFRWSRKCPVGNERKRNDKIKEARCIGR